MILLLSVGGLTVLNLAVPVHAGSIIVPDDYPTIQEAINTADQGDEIFVRAGFYPENIVVNKTVRLRGENRKATVGIVSPVVLEADPCVSITSDKVVFTGFTLKEGASQGISITSNMCFVADNNINGIWGWGGIVLDGRSLRVEGNTIFNNSICGNEDCGITVLTGSRNTITANKVNQNFFVGIYLYLDSCFNLVSGNEVVGNNDAGICLAMNCCNNTIVHNNVSQNGWKWGAITEWYVNGSIWLFQSSCYNTIADNYFSNNRIGVQVESYSDNNMIYHNSFIDNSIQLHHGVSGFPHCTEIWDSGYPSGGNYWSPYGGVDLKSGSGQNESGSDGIGDVPYSLDQQNIDHYPLMQPYSRPMGDIDEDGKVDMRDVGAACSAFGSCAGSAGYNVKADVNVDLRIDLRDIGIICVNYGKH
jgi:parallel beta-helix repeat protein